MADVKTESPTADGDASNADRSGQRQQSAEGRADANTTKEAASARAETVADEEQTSSIQPMEVDGAAPKE